MRLPAVTPVQIKIEDARALHESLWEAFQDGRRIQMDRSEAYRVHGCVHRFWSIRGYLLRIRTVRPRRQAELWLVERVRKVA